MQLDEVTCPCGLGYWNVWKAAFVSGDEIRAGQAPPKEEYVAKVRAELSHEEYEAYIRQQYIRHFLGCKVKRSRDDQVTREGRNDGSSLRRAITEWWEFTGGDFRSRGTSHHYDANRLREMWSRLRGSPVTNNDIRPLLSPQMSTVDDQEADNRHRALAHRTMPTQATSTRHSSTSVQSSQIQVDTRAEGFYRKYFISGEKGIRQDVLAYRCEEGMFGRGATVESYTRPVGRLVRVACTYRSDAYPGWHTGFSCERNN